MRARASRTDPIRSVLAKSNPIGSVQIRSHLIWPNRNATSAASVSQRPSPLDCGRRRRRFEWRHSQRRPPNCKRTSAAKVSPKLQTSQRCDDADLLPLGPKPSLSATRGSSRVASRRTSRPRHCFRGLRFARAEKRRARNNICAHRFLGPHLHSSRLARSFVRAKFGQINFAPLATCNFKLNATQPLCACVCVCVSLAAPKKPNANDTSDAHYGALYQ